MKKLLLIFAALLVSVNFLSANEANEGEEKKLLSAEERDKLIEQTLKERDVVLVIDPWGGKGVECKQLHKTDQGWVGYTGEKTLFFERGYTFAPIAFVDGYRYVFEENGNHYGANMSDVQFADSDDAEELGFMLRGKSEQMSTLAGRFYGTATALYLMLIVMCIAALVALLYLKFGIEKLRSLFLVIVPLAILIFSLIEIYGYVKFGGDIFWWCEYDRYGFFGSLLRVFPFGAMVAAQVYSIKVYERALFLGDDDPNNDDKKISLKPAAWSLALCIPVFIILVFSMAGLGLDDTIWMDIVCIVGFLATLGVGLFISFRRNVKALGRAAGLYVTIFSIVYIIGCIISAIAMITLIFQIILQILTVLAVFLIFAMMGRRRVRYNGRVYEEV